jgi:hypothetical protein
VICWCDQIRDREKMRRWTSVKKLGCSNILLKFYTKMFDEFTQYFIYLRQHINLVEYYTVNFVGFSEIVCLPQNIESRFVFILNEVFKFNNKGVSNKIIFLTNLWEVYIN